MKVMFMNMLFSASSGKKMNKPTSSRGKQTNDSHHDVFFPPLKTILISFALKCLTSPLSRPANKQDV